MFSVTGLLIVFCLVLALRQQAQPLSFLSQSNVGTSGWSLGPAWIMGVGNSMLTSCPVESASKAY